MRVVRSAWLALALATFAACGGSSDDDDSGKSKEELDREIRAEAERLNSCELVEDCQGVGYGCSALFVNKDADTAHLEALIAEKEGDEPLSCPASCACGILSCEAGKCVTASGDCMSTPPGSQMVCL